MTDSTTQPVKEEPTHQVRFDQERRQNYHIDLLGARVYHDVPDGFEFGEQGDLQKVEA